MISVEGASFLSGIKVETKDFGGFTPEELSNRALDKIISVEIGRAHV